MILHSKPPLSSTQKNAIEWKDKELKDKNDWQVCVDKHVFRNHPFFYFLKAVKYFWV